MLEAELLWFAGAGVLVIGAVAYAALRRRDIGPTGKISAAGSCVEAWVIPTDDERMFARHTATLLGLGDN